MVPRFLLRLLGLSVVLLTLGAPPLRAQETPPVEAARPVERLTLGGTLQARLSYGAVHREDADDEDRLGFGVRRLRLQMRARMTERWGAYFQLEGVDSPTIIDIYASYQASDRVRLRIGRMVSAQPRPFILTGHTTIDAVDRAAIAEAWGVLTIDGGGRDFGLDARVQGERGEVLFFLHNGDGSWNRAFGNYSEGISGGVLGGSSGTGLAASVYGDYAPEGAAGLSLGGFASYNAAEGPRTQLGDEGRQYVSYAAHAYLGADPGSRPVRFKADLIGIRYDDLGEGAQHWLGGAFLTAVATSPASEVFARVERLDPNLDASGGETWYLTAGGSLSLSALRGQSYARERLTLAYSQQRFDADGAPVAHIAILQLQVVF